MACMIDSRAVGFVRAALIGVCLIAFAESAAAQQPDRLRLTWNRPDAQSEQASARISAGPTAKPADEHIHSCGIVDIALRRVSYDRPRGLFTYRLVVSPAGQSQWREWSFSRRDVGSFESRVLSEVKVFATDETSPLCSDFSLPLYCIALCANAQWWVRPEGTPEALTVYLGWDRLLDLLLQRKLAVPGKITNALLTINPPDAWKAEASISSQGFDESTVRLELSPRWSVLQDLLLQQERYEARLTYDVEVNDGTADGITKANTIVLPVTVKPALWILIPPVLITTFVGLLIRHYGGRRIRSVPREFGVMALVAIVTWGLLVLFRTRVGIALGEASADGIAGAALIGLMTGLSGRRAIERLYDLFQRWTTAAVGAEKR
jgi:hypothetical protein